MAKLLIVGFALSAIAITGCESPQEAQREQSPVTLVSQRVEEAPGETLNRMLEVASKGDWQTYVDQYYGEQHKFRSSDDRDALVNRFEKKWGEKLVPALSRAAKLPVQIDGDNALFLDGDETVFVLHRSEGGAWKFHL